MCVNVGEDNLVGGDVPEIVRPLALQAALDLRWGYRHNDYDHDHDHHRDTSCDPPLWHVLFSHHSFNPVIRD